jgi:hypothetical protein
MLIRDEAFKLHPWSPCQNKATTGTNRGKLNHQEKAKSIENRSDLRGRRFGFRKK